MAAGSEGTVPAPTDVRIGTRVAGYQVDGLLGRGSTSVVYRAWDLRLRRRVALKVLAPELASDSRFRERFLAESELAASIDHPNITPIYEAGAGDGCLFIAMRYVEGPDLRAQLHREGPLEPERALAIAAQVAAALDAAHEHGLVHRDVKPSNVLLGPRGHCYLSDFGLTKRASDRSGLSGRPQIVGTVDYVAPEQLRGDPVDSRADVYSLACLVFESLTGEVPFSHDSEVAVLYAQLEEQPPRPSERRPGLPAAVDAPLVRAMAKLPADRYASCGELVGAVHASLGLSGPRAHERKDPRRLWLALAGGVVVASAAIGSWLLSGSAAPAVPRGTSALVRVDPATNHVGPARAVGRGARSVAVGAGAVWVANHDDDSVSRVDLASSSVRTIHVKGTPIDLAANARVVDVVDGPSNISVVSIDPATNQAGEPTTFPGDVSYAPLIAGSGRTLLLADAEAQTLAASDSGGRFLGVGGPISIPPDGTSLLTEYVSFDGLAVGNGVAWIAGDVFGRSIWRIDLASRGVRRVALPFAPAGVAAGEGAVWVTSLLDDEVVRIDAVSGRIVDRVRVGRGGGAIAAGDGAVWTADTLDRSLSKIDPRTDSVTTIPLGMTPVDVAAGDGGVWVIGTKT